MNASNRTIAWLMFASTVIAIAPAAAQTADPDPGSQPPAQVQADASRVTSDNANAPEEATPFITFTGTAAFVSDYRFRGASLSDKDFAIQGSITATTAPGFYVGLWGSSIEQFAGAETEIDITAGWSGSVGPATLNVGGIYYVYPGGEDIDYVEVFGSFSGTLGPVSATVGINYAPDQENLFDDNVYVYFSPSAAIPNTPVTIKGSIGYEDGSLAQGVGAENDKIDWMIGADLKYRALILGIQYIDNDLDRNNFNRRNTKAGLVVSLTAAF